MFLVNQLVLEKNNKTLNFLSNFDPNVTRQGSSFPKFQIPNYFLMVINRFGGYLDGKYFQKKFPTIKNTWQPTAYPSTYVYSYIGLKSILIYYFVILASVLCT